MEFGEKIRMLRKQQGLTLEAVGNIVGVGKSTVRKWESGQIANMGRDKIAALAKALCVSPGYLMGWEEDATGGVPLPHPELIPVRPARLPLLGPVAAGKPMQAAPEDVDYVDLPYLPDKRVDACLRVRGDSMIPKFLDGDIVFIRFQDDVEDGQIAAICIDDAVALKRVHHIPNGVTLVSENSEKYSPMTYTLDDANNIHLLGLAVGFMRWEH